MAEATRTRQSELQKLNLITLRMGNHAGPSGYDRVADVLDAKVLETRPIASLGQKIVGKTFAKLVSNSGTAWYSRRSFLTELSAAALWHQGEGQLFHFLYGENSFRYLHNIKRVSARKNWLVATFHTPDWKFHEKVKRKDHLKSLDGIITVSSGQVPMLEAFNPGRVHYVPHGVDTNFFRPNPIDKKYDAANFLMVGSHLRDFELACQAIPVISEEYPEVTFDIVARPEHLKHFDNMPAVRLHKNISDDELLSLYQSADALLMPLLDSTANNTLLESVACGLPVITTNLVGTKDYAPSCETRWVEKGDLDSLVHAIREVCDNRTSPEQRKRVRQHALNFDWSSVAARLMKTYDEIILAA